MSDVTDVSDNGYVMNVYNELDEIIHTMEVPNEKIGYREAEQNWSGLDWTLTPIN